MPTKDISAIRLVQLVDDTGAALGVTASTTAKSTAAAPSYVEGSTNPISSDLTGALRVTGSFSASSSVKATSAAPTYTEGSTTNPVSTDLSGQQRVVDSALATAVGSTNTKLDTLHADVDGLETLVTATNTKLDTLHTDATSTTTINTAEDTAVVKNGATDLTPKFVAIAASSSGNNTVLAAVASKKIRVLAAYFNGNGAVNAKFQSGAGGTDLTGLTYIPAAGNGMVLPYNPKGWFETASNTLLNLNLSAAIAVGGALVYVEV